MLTETPPANPPETPPTPPATPPASPPEGFVSKDELAALQAKLDKAIKDGEELKTAASIAKALEPYYEIVDGEIILKAPARSNNAADPYPDKPPIDETTVTRKATEVSLTMADLIQQDADFERRLAAANKNDPILPEIIDQVREIVKKVPLERRKYESWTGALELVRGRNMDKYRKLHEMDGAQRAVSELEKQRGASVPSSVPAKTVKEVVDGLTERERQLCEKMGWDPKRYAVRKAELDGQPVKKEE